MIGRTIPDRWPTGLIGMVAMICAAEWFVLKRMNDWVAPEIMEWRATGRSAANDSQGTAVLCFGSSLVKHGVLPAVVEERAGLRGYNLALPGAMPPVTYYLLRRALACGASPSAVIVDFDHTHLADEPCTDQALHAWSHVLSPLEAFDLALRNGNGSFLGRLLVSNALPSVRSRLDIRAAVVAALDNRALPRRAAFGAYERNRRLNRGALVNPKVPTFVDTEAPAVMPDKSASWKCHPINEIFVDRFLSLAGARGTSVFWLMLPFPPGHQALIDRTRSEETYLRYARRLLERYPHLTVIDGRHSNYPASVFIDPVHLDRTGASALSDSLAPLLVSQNRERWITLERFRPSPREPELEDCLQSALVLQKATETARR